MLRFSPLVWPSHAAPSDHFVRLARTNLGSRHSFGFMELQDVKELTNFFEQHVSAYQVAVKAKSRSTTTTFEALNRTRARPLCGAVVRFRTIQVTQLMAPPRLRA